jgi:hypothetical protein
LGIEISDCPRIERLEQAYPDKRFGASIHGELATPPEVRLACQIRPTAALAIDLLVSPIPQSQPGVERFGAAIEGGKELEIAARATA